MEYIEENAERQESRPTVLVIGSNVLMEAVANCLREERVPNLIQWDSINFGWEANLHVTRPGLIIFDFDTPYFYLLCDLLREQPGIHLIGLDQNRDQVVVFNSFTRDTRTLIDLNQIVQEVSESWE